MLPVAVHPSLFNEFNRVLWRAESYNFHGTASALFELLQAASLVGLCSLDTENSILLAIGIERWENCSLPLPCHRGAAKLLFD